jgi:hypothetical protein
VLVVEMPEDLISRGFRCAAALENCKKILPADGIDVNSVRFGALPRGALHHHLLNMGGNISGPRRECCRKHLRSKSSLEILPQSRDNKGEDSWSTSTSPQHAGEIGRPNVSNST